MAALFVVVLSIAAGAATYVATVRGGRRIPAAVGFDTPPGGTAVAAVALGPETVLEPAADGPPADDATEAEIVDLGSARTPASTEHLTVPADEIDPAAHEEPDAVAEDAGAAPMPLAPVVVTAAAVPAPEPGYAYLRVSTGKPSWRDRIAGIVGIAVLLVLGAAAIAFGIYELGVGISALIQRFLNG